MQKRVVPSWKVDMDSRETEVAEINTHHPGAYEPASSQLPKSVPDLGIIHPGPPDSWPEATFSRTVGEKARGWWDTWAQGNLKSNHHSYAMSAFGSTGHQDMQECPLIRLPDSFILLPGDLSTFKQAGKWVDEGGMQLAYWMRNFLSMSWDTVYLANANNQMAVKGPVSTEQMTYKDYGFVSTKLPSSYPGLRPFEARKVHNARKKKGSTLGDSTVVPFLDCGGDLLFVAAFYAEQPAPNEHLMGQPGWVDIYDRDGNLLAHTIDSMDVFRSEFVDTNGHLLAIAESPAVGQNVSRSDMPRDPIHGNVLPYSLRFEKGGYANASRLMDAEFRWVIAYAVQVRAVFEGELYTNRNDGSSNKGHWDFLHTDFGVTVETANGWRPNAKLMGVLVSWAIFSGFVFLMCTGCYCTYRVVFQEVPSSRKEPELVRTGAGFRGARGQFVLQRSSPRAPLRTLRPSLPSALRR